MAGTPSFLSGSVAQSSRVVTGVSAAQSGLPAAANVSKQSVSVAATAIPVAVVAQRPPVNELAAAIGIPQSYFDAGDNARAAYGNRYPAIPQMFNVAFPPSNSGDFSGWSKPNDVTLINRRYWSSEWQTQQVAPSSTSVEYLFAKEKYVFAQNQLQALLQWQNTFVRVAADGGFSWCHYAADMIDLALYATNLDPTVLGALLDTYIPLATPAGLDAIAPTKRSNALYARVQTLMAEVASYGNPPQFFDRGVPKFGLKGEASNGVVGLVFESRLFYNNQFLRVLNYVRNGGSPVWGRSTWSRDVQDLNSFKYINEAYFAANAGASLDGKTGREGPRGIIEDLAAWAQFIIATPYEHFLTEGFDMWARTNLLGQDPDRPTIQQPRFSSEDVVKIGDADKAAAKAAFIGTLTSVAAVTVGAVSGQFAAAARGALALATQPMDVSSGLFGEPIEQPFRRVYEDPDYTTDVSTGDTQTVIDRIAANSVRLADLVGIPFAEMFRKPAQVPEPIAKMYSPPPPPLFTPPPVKRGISTPALVVGGLALVTGLVMAFKLKGR